MRSRRARAARAAPWVAGCAALLAGLALLTPRLPPAGPVAAAVLVPPEVPAARTTPVYGGLGPLARPGRADLMVCAATDDCRVIASTPLALGQRYWGWLGALRLDAGDHQVELLVRERTRWFGMRTVARGVWHVVAR